MAPPGPKTKKKSAGVVVPRATFRIKIDGEEVFEIEHPKVELFKSSARERDLEEDEVHDGSQDDEQSHSPSELFDAKEIEEKSKKEVSDEEDSPPDLIRNRYHAYGDYVNYDDDYYHDGHFNLLEPPAPEKKRQYYYKPIGAPPAPGPPPTYHYYGGGGGGGHYSSAPVWSPPHSPTPFYYPSDVEVVVDEKDCCPIVADPLAVLGLLGFIFFSTAFLNVAVSMNIGKKKRRRRRSSKDVSFAEEVLLQGTAQGKLCAPACAPNEKNVTILII